MKKFIQGVINKVFRKKLTLLYGKNAKVVVEDYYWSRRNKNYTISLTIYTDSIDDALEIHPDGIEVIVSTVMKLMNVKGLIRVVSSLKYIEDGTPNSTL
jgi:hypothetical protein